MASNSRLCTSQLSNSSSQGHHPEPGNISSLKTPPPDGQLILSNNVPIPAEAGLAFDLTLAELDELERSFNDPVPTPSPPSAPSLPQTPPPPTLFTQISGFIAIEVFTHAKSFSATVKHLQENTNLDLSWQVLFSLAKSIAAKSYIAYEYPLHPLALACYGVSTMDYRGLSLSQKEWDARLRMWALRRDIWDSLLENLGGDEGECRNQVCELLTEEACGIFCPWEENEVTRMIYGSGRKAVHEQYFSWMRTRPFQLGLWW